MPRGRTEKREVQPKLDPTTLIDWERVHMPTIPPVDGRCGFEFHFPGESTSYCVDVQFHEASDDQDPANPADPNNYTLGEIDHWVTDDDSESVENDVVEQLLKRYGLSLQQLFETVLERAHLHEL